MYDVSSEYKTQIESTVRNPSHMRIKFAIIEQDTYDDASTDDDGEAMSFSEADALLVDTDVKYNYDSLEDNRLILDKQHTLATSSYGEYQGYVSSELSNASCVFTNEPYTYVQFSSPHSLAGIYIRFDVNNGGFPSRFNVSAYNASMTVLYDADFTNTATSIMIEENIPTCTYIAITALESDLPYTRFRVQYIALGLVKELTDDVIVSSVDKKALNLISTKLPKGDFEFTMLDLENEYDPDNPAGLFGYIEKGQPIKFEYGYTLNDGTIEWILGGNYFTTGEISNSNSSKISKVTFKAVDTLNNLTDIYFKGTYSATPKSLHTLATEVLAETDATYTLDPSLQTLYSSHPLPKKPIKECLQLIANAGLCTLAVDRDGTIVFKKIDLTATSEDFKFDFENSTSVPLLKKAPLLKNLTASYYDIEVTSTSEKLSEIPIAVTSNTEFYFEYPMSDAVTLTVGSGLTLIGSVAYYAETCVATLVGTGTITISGKKLIVSENTMTDVINETGVDCAVKNVLIDTSIRATSYGTWIANDLELRTEYAIDNRGYPEIDVCDIVELQTLYSDTIKTVVVSNEIAYDGTISATSKVLATS